MNQVLSRMLFYIKIFNNENRGLIEEKEDLKGKLTKFDAIVYGKLKKKK